MSTEPSTDPTPLPGPSPQPGGVRVGDDFAALEDIRGPYFGHFVAAYTIEREEGYFAFAKVCPERPQSVWETPDARAILSAGPRADAKTALEDVFKSAHERLRGLRANLLAQLGGKAGD